MVRLSRKWLQVRNWALILTLLLSNVATVLLLSGDDRPGDSTLGGQAADGEGTELPFVDLPGQGTSGSVNGAVEELALAGDEQLDDRDEHGIRIEGYDIRNRSKRSSRSKSGRRGQRRGKGAKGAEDAAAQGGSSEGTTEGDPSGTDAEDDAQDDDEQDDEPEGTGLLGRYFDHRGSVRRMPKDSFFRNTKPTLARLDPRVDFGRDDAFRLPFRPDTFSVEWVGWYRAAEAGVYRFEIGSDDGSHLEIDNRRVINNGGLHGHRPRAANVELTAGFHVVRMTMFENHGAASMRLRVATPTSGTLEVAPTKSLFPPGHPDTVGLPAVDTVTPPRAVTGAQVLLRGRGFGHPGGVKVSIGGVPARVLQVTPLEVLFEVPDGTDGGALVVEAGGVVSARVPFGVDGVFGLYGRYLDLEDQLATYVPPGSGGAGFSLERIDSRLYFKNGRAFGLPFSDQTFSATHTGSIFVHRTGLHTFYITSDDGSQLTIGGQVVVDNGGLHGPRRRSGEVFLTWGRHPLRVDYFQNRGRAVLELEFKEPEGKRRLVPRGVLAPPDWVRNQPVPVISKLEPKAAAPGDQVEIRGSDLTTTGAPQPRVTLRGRQVEVVAANHGSIIIRVPDLVDSGPIVVHTGPLKSKSAHLTVTGYGLTGTYYDLPNQRIERIPPLDTLQPTLVRVDGRVDFRHNGSFKVPFHPDTFAVRWEGTFLAQKAGTYTFILGSDDGSRLFVAGQELLADQGLHGYKEFAATIDLLEGRVPIRVEWFENYGGASCRLFYKRPGSRKKRVVPRVLLKPH